MYFYYSINISQLHIEFQFGAKMKYINRSDVSAVYLNLFSGDVDFGPVPFTLRDLSTSILTFLLLKVPTGVTTHRVVAKIFYKPMLNDPLKQI
jgi:hypothetical protein